MILEEDRQRDVEETEEQTEGTATPSSDGSDTDTASENSQTSTVEQSSKLCQANIWPSTRTRRIQVKPSRHGINWDNVHIANCTTRE